MTDVPTGPPNSPDPASPSIGEMAFRLSLDAIVVMDNQGEVIGWNPAAESLFGWSSQEAVGKRVMDLIVPEQYRAVHENGLKRFRETGEGPVLGKVLDILTAVRRDGSEFPLEIRISHASGGPAEATFVAFLRDISTAKWAERNLQARYAVTRAIASHAPWGEVVDLVLAGAGEQLGFVLGEVWLVEEGERNLRWEATWSLAGTDVRPFAAASMETPINEGDGILGRAWADRAGLRGDLDSEPESRLRAARACALGTALAAPIFGGDIALGVVAFYRAGPESPTDPVALEVLADIGFQLGQHLERVRVEEALRTAQQTMRSELEEQANSDALTGLINRQGFDQRVQLAVAHGRRQADQFALLMLDLDGFKAVNDTHGHGTGDHLLQLVASRLTEIVRDSDMVSRLGGDEFAVLSAPGVDIDGARRLAAKVIGIFDADIAVDDVPINVSPSVGIALFPAHGMDAGTLLHNADAAMYLAKRTRSGHAMYREGLPAGRGASQPLHQAGASND